MTGSRAALLSRTAAAAALMTLAAILLVIPSGCGDDGWQVYVYDQVGPLAGVEVYDDATGELYGTTDEQGKATVKQHGDVPFLRLNLKWAAGREDESLGFRNPYTLDVENLLSGQARPLRAYPIEDDPNRIASLTIRSTPNSAKVYLDDVFMGHTEIQIPDLLALQVYRIELRLDGWKSQSKVVELEPGANVEEWVLEEDRPQTATLHVNSRPNGARISLNGNATGRQTPASFMGLSPGSHQVRLELDGYRVWRKTYDLSAGQERTVNATLRSPEPDPVEEDDEPEPEPEPRQVFRKEYRISTVPHAYVYVDGSPEKRNLVGHFTMTLTEGEHSFHLVKEERGIDMVLTYTVTRGDINSVIVLDCNEGRAKGRPR